MPNIIQITPFMQVGDMEKALAFFTGVLGFEATFRLGNYAYVRREGAAFRLIEEEDPTCLQPGTRRFAYYIDVRDVDALYAELKPKLDTLPAGDVYGPAEQSYGQRELVVLAPDGNLIAFGQFIRQADESTATAGAS